MKRTLFIFLVLISFKAAAQPVDSVKLFVTIQVRDLEYISAITYNALEAEEIMDSIKSKARAGNFPTGNTAIAIGGYVIDWAYIYERLSRDNIALMSNTTSRVESALRATGDATIAAKIDAIAAWGVQIFQDVRRSGRNRLRRVQ